MLDVGLTKWVKVGGVTDAQKVARDRDVNKVMAAYGKDLGT